MKQPSRRPLHPRSPRAALILALGFVLALGACASGSGGSGSGGSGDVITQAQIDEAALDTALDVVRHYRPRWLQPARSPSSSSLRPVAGRPGMPQDGGDQVAADVYPVVIRDGVRYGELDSLSSISPGTVASIQFVSPGDARTRYGAGFEGGVIEVLSR